MKLFYFYRGNIIEQQSSEDMYKTLSQDKKANSLANIESHKNTIKKKKKRKVLVFLATLLLLVLISSIGVFLWRGKDRSDTDVFQQERSSDKEPGSNGDESESEPLDQSSNAVENRYILFSHNDELWISDWNGENQHSLELGDIAVSFNGFNDRWIFFQTGLKESLQVYDLRERKISDLGLDIVKYPGGTGGYHKPFSISPDGKSIVAYFYYTKDDCKELPCNFEPPASAQKAGYYSYNVETDKKIYLDQDLVMISPMWSKDSRYFYAYQQILTTGSDGAYDQRNIRFDTITGKKKIIEVTKYPNEWGAEDGSNYFFDGFTIRLESSMANYKARIVFEKNAGQQTIDMSNYGGIQGPFMPSPQQDKALYYRSRPDDQTPSGVEKDRYLLDLITTDTKKILSAREDEDLGFQSYWVNNDYFITKVIKYSEQSTPNSAGDVLLVDTQTGERKMITEFGDIQLFGNPAY